MRTAPQPVRPVRIGSGSGWARDRFGPALDLVQRGDLDYLCFDSMSEVTMSAAQVARRGATDPSSIPPYDPYLEARLGPLLAPAKERGVRIVTNQGWLDPDLAARRMVELAREQGIEDLTVAAVSSPDLTDDIIRLGLHFTEDGSPILERRADIVSAEAYLGAGGIIAALDAGADIVITTRVADGCLYLGPLAHHLGWDLSDADLVGRGMVVGHLMECGAQVSGGYYADPGYKDVPDLATIGNPIVEVGPDHVLISKLEGTGGLLDTGTCKEQLLYEVEDPGSYYCPDAIIDLTQVSFSQVGRDKVAVHIAPNGRPAPPTLKTLVGLVEGYLAEEMVIFAGPGAIDRARLTQEVLEQRFDHLGLQAQEVRFDYLGVNAVHREATPERHKDEPWEIVLRVAVKTTTMEAAALLQREIDPLAVNGASGTGKWATSNPGQRIRPIVGLSSCLVPREVVTSTLTLHSSSEQRTRTA